MTNTTNAPLFIDARALAEVLASRQWPVDECTALLVRFFTLQKQYAVAHAERDAYRSILNAAREERPQDLPAMMDRICALIDWRDFNDGELERRNRHIGYVLDDVGPNTVREEKWWDSDVPALRPHEGKWLVTSPTNVVCLLKLLNIPEANNAERGHWAAKIVRALEWNDRGAFDAVAARIGPEPPPSERGYVSWQSTDEMEARVFALLTSAKASDEERALRPLEPSSFDDTGCSRACVSFFAMERGVVRARPRAERPEWRRSQRDWAEYAAFLRTAFPARVHDAMPAWFEKMSRFAGFPEVCDELADEKIVDGDAKTTWRIGPHRITHAGGRGRGRGRWFFSTPKPGKPRKQQPALAAGPA